MTKTLKIVLAQLNLTVGDIEANLQKHIQAAQAARDDLSADVIVFPELSLIGYPSEDLLYRRDYLESAEQALNNFVEQVKNIYCIISHPQRKNNRLYNACSIIFNGKILDAYSKQHLPNHGVFDEKRYFSIGDQTCVVNIKGVPVGVVICEDLWAKEPVTHAAKLGARLILSPNASPFEVEKHEERVSLLSDQAAAFHLPIVYVNHVGGQDDLIFDGGSMVVDAQGSLCQCADFFKEALLPVTIEFTDKQAFIACAEIKPPSKLERIYQALVLAMQDYLKKNGLKKVFLGLSGGIDSALVLAIAVDALGKNQVEAVMLPSRYTLDISLEDAKKIAENFDVKYHNISIESSFQAFLTTLENNFAGMQTDITEENLQARCRAVILMALSNKFGGLVLTTSNRSELAVGYGTLYGDMAGGFAVLKDIPKTLVYELASYRNSLHPDIPQRIIDRAPTAELAPGQTDQDTLPPYAMLDLILERYINQQQDIEEIVAAGFHRSTVEKIIQLIRINEYKRKQAPLGPRINHRAFGKDRRYPVTNQFKK